MPWLCVHTRVAPVLEARHRARGADRGVRDVGPRVLAPQACFTARAAAAGSRFSLMTSSSVASLSRKRGSVVSGRSADSSHFALRAGAIRARAPPAPRAPRPRRGSCRRAPRPPRPGQRATSPSSSSGEPGPVARRAHDAAVQHAVEVEVVHEDRGAAHLGRDVAPRRRGADHGVLRCGLGRDLAGRLAREQVIGRDLPVGDAAAGAGRDHAVGHGKLLQRHAELLRGPLQEEVARFSRRVAQRGAAIRDRLAARGHAFVGAVARAGRRQPDALERRRRAPRRRSARARSVCPDRSRPCPGRP